jgi:hypothetical protein
MSSATRFGFRHSDLIRISDFVIRDFRPSPNPHHPHGQRQHRNQENQRLQHDRHGEPRCHGLSLLSANAERTNMKPTSSAEKHQGKCFTPHPAGQIAGTQFYRRG